MSFRRPLTSLAPKLERVSTCRRSLSYQASPAIQNRAPQPPPMPRTRRITTTPIRRQKAANKPTSSAPSTSPSQSAPSTIYTYEVILALTQSPDPNRILIGTLRNPPPLTFPTCLPPLPKLTRPSTPDVREPSELTLTGTIPTSVNIPIQTSPDFAFLPPAEFLSRFGFPRPTPEQEVVFYCKAGVRSRAAAKLARQGGFGGRVGEFPGSWAEWSAKGGRVEKG